MVVVDIVAVVDTEAADIVELDEVLLVNLIRIPHKIEHCHPL
jgi:hypothetical protein